MILKTWNFLIIQPTEEKKILKVELGKTMKYLVHFAPIAPLKALTAASAFRSPTPQCSPSSSAEAAVWTGEVTSHQLLHCEFKQKEKQVCVCGGGGHK